jgi:glycosyltransferase involved in cell wall biosynthesis
MRVTYIHREKRSGNYSFETIFSILSRNIKSANLELRHYFRKENESRLLSIYKVGRQESDIFHITGDVNFLAIGLPGRKTILTIHDLGFLENPIHNAFKRIIYRIFWFEIPLRRVKFITTVSQFTKEKIIEHFNIAENKIKVIPNPVTLNPAQKKEDFKMNGCPKILQIGTGAHKNLNRLLKAIVGLHVQIIIIGNPNKEDLAFIKENHIKYKIYFDITREKLVNLFREADVLFFASIYEGFGLPIIEANQIGVPVITSNICSMPEVAGNAALIVDPLNVEEIRKGIQLLLSDMNQRMRLIRNGFENVKKFDLQTISREYINLYKLVNDENQ